MRHLKTPQKKVTRFPEEREKEIHYSDLTSSLKFKSLRNDQKKKQDFSPCPTEPRERGRRGIGVPTLFFFFLFRSSIVLL